MCGCKNEKKVITIKYFNPEMPEIASIDKGDWIDLRISETVIMETGQYKLLPLGVAMKIPEGYEAHLKPRSSTFKNYGIIQTNSVGVIDGSYAGNDDQWMMPVFATRSIAIPQFDRICQFRIVKKMEPIEFQSVTNMEDESRGGFGSTGTK